MITRQQGMLAFMMMYDVSRQDQKGKSKESIYETGAGFTEIFEEFGEKREKHFWK